MSHVQPRLLGKVSEIEQASGNAAARASAATASRKVHVSSFVGSDFHAAAHFPHVGICAILMLRRSLFHPSRVQDLIRDARGPKPAIPSRRPPTALQPTAKRKPDAWEARDGDWPLAKPLAAAGVPQSQRERWRPSESAICSRIAARTRIRSHEELKKRRASYGSCRLVVCARKHGFRQICCQYTTIHSCELIVLRVPDRFGTSHPVSSFSGSARCSSPLLRRGLHWRVFRILEALGISATVQGLFLGR